MVQATTWYSHHYVFFVAVRVHQRLLDIGYHTYNYHVLLAVQHTTPHALCPQYAVRHTTPRTLYTYRHVCVAVLAHERLLDIGKGVGIEQGVHEALEHALGQQRQLVREAVNLDLQACHVRASGTHMRMTRITHEDGTVLPCARIRNTHQDDEEDEHRRDVEQITYPH
jgi:hypothetical protein